MKNKGFTIVELVAACTLLIMLSTIATTSTFNFVQATGNLKAQYNNIQNIMALHSVLVRAKMNYATDLAIASSSFANNPSNPSNSNNPAEQAISNWNTSAGQNNNQELINLLITPPTGFQPDLPLAPLNPGSRSYLPTFRNVPVTTMINGNPVISYVMVQITDMESLLKAYQLTDSGAPTGNIVATISVGPMLNISTTGATVTATRPMLPVIDWKSGTLQEIQF